MPLNVGLYMAGFHAPLTLMVTIYLQVVCILAVRWIPYYKRVCRGQKLL